VVALAYVICAVIWGTTWFVIRESTPVGGFPPYLGCALRFTVAAVILWALVAVGVGRPLPRGARLGWLCAAGAINGVSYTLVYTAERQPGGLPGGLMAVLFGTIPLLTAVAATVLRIERITSAQVAGAVVSLVGIALISFDRIALGGGQGVELAAALGAVVCSVGYAILLKRGMQGVAPIGATTVFLTVTAAVSWVFGAPELGAMPWPMPLGPTLATLYLAVLGSVVAFAAYLYLLKHVSLMIASSLVLLQPVIALVVDALFERRVTLARLSYVGIAITLSGVLVSWVVKLRSGAHAEPL
jgi:drug/metabolite transporter (DMT)-like permease